MQFVTCIKLDLNIFLNELLLVLETADKPTDPRAVATGPSRFCQSQVKNNGRVCVLPVRLPSIYGLMRADLSMVVSGADGRTLILAHRCDPCPPQRGA